MRGALKPEKTEMQSTCCPHHWLYSCLLSCLQAMSIPLSHSKAGLPIPASAKPFLWHRQSHHTLQAVQGSPGYQEREQGDHMKQDKLHISNQGIVIWHPQEMRISTTSPELGQAVVGRGTNLYQDYPEGQCNYLYLNVCTQSSSNGPQACHTTAGNNPRHKGSAAGTSTACRSLESSLLDQSYQKTSQAEAPQPPPQMIL